MELFAILAGLLVTAGTGLAFYFPSSDSIGAWITVLVLLIIAFIGRTDVRNEEKP